MEAANKSSPSVGKWINKLVDPYNGMLLSNKKKNELSSHKKSWKALKSVTLSARSQTEKATYYIIPTFDSRKTQNYEDSKKVRLPGSGWGDSGT